MVGGGTLVFVPEYLSTMDLELAKNVSNPEPFISPKMGLPGHTWIWISVMFLSSSRAANTEPPPPVFSVRIYL